MTATDQYFLVGCLRYLGGRHPAEVNLSVSQLMEVFAVAPQLEKMAQATGGIRI